MNGVARKHHAVDCEKQSGPEDRWARFDALLKADAQGASAKSAGAALTARPTANHRHPKAPKRAGAYAANLALGSLAAALVCGIGATLMLA